MKKPIFAWAMALLFVCMNVSAESFTLGQVNRKMFSALQDEGYLTDLTPEQIKKVAEIVSNAVSQEFIYSNTINLSEENVQHGLLGDVWERVKSSVKAGVGIVKTGLSALFGMSKKIAHFLVDHKDTLMRNADKAIPAIVPIANRIADKIGVNPELVKGLLGTLPEDEQKELAIKGEDAVADKVKELVEEKAD